jgi:hypothetical protein
MAAVSDRPYRAFARDREGNWFYQGTWSEREVHARGGPFQLLVTTYPEVTLYRTTLQEEPHSSRPYRRVGCWRDGMGGLT